MVGIVHSFGDSSNLAPEEPGNHSDEGADHPECDADPFIRAEHARIVPRGHTRRRISSAPQLVVVRPQVTTDLLDLQGHQLCCRMWQYPSPLRIVSATDHRDGVGQV